MFSDFFGNPRDNYYRQQYLRQKQAEEQRRRQYLEQQRRLQLQRQREEELLRRHYAEPLAEEDSDEEELYSDEDLYDFPRRGISQRELQKRQEAERIAQQKQQAEALARKKQQEQEAHKQYVEKQRKARLRLEKLKLEKEERRIKKEERERAAYIRQLELRKAEAAITVQKHWRGFAVRKLELISTLKKIVKVEMEADVIIDKFYPELSKQSVDTLPSLPNKQKFTYKLLAFEEELLRKLFALDSVSTRGNELLRTRRKALVTKIQSKLAIVDTLRKPLADLVAKEKASRKKVAAEATDMEEHVYSGESDGEVYSDDY